MYLTLLRQRYNSPLYLSSGHRYCWYIHPHHASGGKINHAMARHEQKRMATARVSIPERYRHSYHGDKNSRGDERWVAKVLWPVHWGSTGRCSLLILRRMCVLITTHCVASLGRLMSGFLRRFSSRFEFGWVRMTISLAGGFFTIKQLSRSRGEARTTAVSTRASSLSVLHCFRVLSVVMSWTSNTLVRSKARASQHAKANTG